MYVMFQLRPFTVHNVFPCFYGPNKVIIIIVFCHPLSLYGMFMASLFKPNIHGWKRAIGRPKARWADSIKHDLYYAAEMVLPFPVEGFHKWNADDQI